MITICKICRSKKTEYVGKNLELTKNGLEVYKCNDCGVGFISPSPTPKILDRYYSNYDFDNELEKTSVIHKKIMPKLTRLHSSVRAKDRAIYVNSFFDKQGSILEIGGARGEFLGDMKSRKWSTGGVELSKQFIKECFENYGIKVYDNFSAYKNKKFDSIAMFHILEHTTNPINELKNLKKYLKKGGLIFIEVPHFPKNIKHWFPDESKPREFYDSHTFHFTPKSLRLIAEKANLEIVDLERIISKSIFSDANLYDLFPGRRKSILSSVKGITNAFYNVLLYLVNRRTTKTIENWEGIDYFGTGDFIRVILSH